MKNKTPVPIQRFKASQRINLTLSAEMADMLNAIEANDLNTETGRLLASMADSTYVSGILYLGCRRRIEAGLTPQTPNDHP